MPNDDTVSTPVDKERNLLDVSRRHLLRSVAITAGGGAILFATAMPAEAKMSQKAAAYQDTPKGDNNCANCALFKSPSSCTLVDGTISPTGWCKFFDLPD